MPEHALNTLNDLFMQELGDILDAEYQITEALPNMVDAASTPAVKARFEEHLKTTRQQIDRLHQVYATLHAQPEREHCAGMAGLLQEGATLMATPGDPMVKDAGLIAAAQRVEHYEIAAYGTLAAYADILGHRDIAGLLHTTLMEERHTDETLTDVAMRSVNKKAA